MAFVTERHRVSPNWGLRSLSKTLSQWLERPVVGRADHTVAASNACTIDRSNISHHQRASDATNRDARGSVGKEENVPWRQIWSRIFLLDRLPTRPNPPADLQSFLSFHPTSPCCPPSTTCLMLSIYIFPFI